jgi:hypothetical protein
LASADGGGEFHPSARPRGNYIPLLVEAPEPLAPLPGMPVVLEDPFVPPLGPEPGVPLGDATVPVPGEFMLPFALPLPEALAPVPEPVVPAEPAPPLLAPPAPA